MNAIERMQQLDITARLQSKTEDHPPDVPTWLLAIHGVAATLTCEQSTQVDKTTQQPPERNTVNPGKPTVISGNTDVVVNNDRLTDKEWNQKFRTYHYTNKKTKITHLVIERRDFSWTRTK